MYKPTKRKGFNFFRSYFDVYNELENDADKLAFIDALLNRQFLGLIPEGLKGMAKFAYISQVNSIDAQVKGYETKTGDKITPTEGARQGGKDTPARQVEVEEEVQVEEKEKGEGEVMRLLNDDSVFISIDSFIEIYKYYVDHQKILCEENGIENSVLLSKLGEFKKARIKEGKRVSTNFGDFCSHFKNWIRKNKDNPKTSTKQERKDSFSKSLKEKLGVNDLTKKFFAEMTKTIGDKFAFECIDFFEIEKEFYKFKTKQKNGVRL